MTYTTETLVAKEVLCCVSTMMCDLSNVAHILDGYEEYLSLMGPRIDTDEGEEFEVYEHWVVSDWLAEKLADHGEVVEDYLGLTIWGRTCTGQSISMDTVIEDIVEEINER